MTMESPTQTPEFKTMKTVVTSPMTWLPLTGATGVVCLLPLPWWLSLLVVGGTVGGILALWKNAIPRLVFLYQAQERADSLKRAEEQETNFLQSLRANGFPQAADHLRKAQEAAKEIQSLVEQNAWLETFGYGDTMRTLIADMRTRAAALLETPRDDRTGAERAPKETFATEYQAIEETLQNIQQVLADKSQTEATPENAVEKLRKANEISRRAREQAKRAIQE